MRMVATCVRFIALSRVASEIVCRMSTPTLSSHENSSTSVSVTPRALDGVRLRLQLAEREPHGGQQTGRSLHRERGDRLCTCDHRDELIYRNYSYSKDRRKY